MVKSELVTYTLEVFVKGKKVWERNSFSPFDDVEFRVNAKMDDEISNA